MLESHPSSDAKSRAPKGFRPGTSPQLGAGALRGQIAAMWAQGMSATAIRRALGLSERDAVGHGIIPGKAWRGRESGVRNQGSGVGDRESRSVDPRYRVPDTSAGPGTLRMINVVDAVAAETGQTRAALLGAGQGRRLAGFRQLTMSLLRQCCAGASLPTIGFVLGRDHSTVLYGIRRAEARLACDPEFRALHGRIRRSLLTRKEEEIDGEAAG